MITKKELKKEFLGFQYKGVRFKLREWVAIVIGAGVFGVSLSYMFLAPDIGAFYLVMLTVTVNFFVYGMRDLIRLVFDKHYKVHTEWHLWFVGAVITAITGWFGNTFCLSGYTVSEGSHEKHGKVAYITNLITFLILTTTPQDSIKYSFLMAVALICMARPRS